MVLGTLMSQDLEETTVPTVTNRAKVEEMITPPSEADTGHPTDNVSKSIQSETLSIDKERSSDTYRKEEYLGKLLRNTYYQKITTPSWSKYLNPPSWKRNVLKWRYWSQLKDYITGNQDEIIVIRSRVKPEHTDTMTADTPLADASLLSSELMTDSSTTVTANVDVQDSKNFSPEEDRPGPILKSTEDTQIVEARSKAAKSEESNSAKEDVVEKKRKVDNDMIKSTQTSQPLVNTPASEPISQKTQSSIERKVSQNTPPTTNDQTNALPLADRATLSRNFIARKGGLPWPVKRGKVTDRFGIRENAIARGLRPENYGVDMLCPAGTIVSAIFDGTVLMAKRQSPYDYIVTVKHGDYTSAHYYLITPYVKPGQVVRAGEPLGKLRTSVAEADFHFEIWNNQDRVNPELWLKRK